MFDLKFFKNSKHIKILLIAFVCAISLASAILLNVRAESNNHTPFGYIDSITEDNVVSGWACDLDTSPENLEVELYVKNPYNDGRQYVKGDAGYQTGFPSYFYMGSAFPMFPRLDVNQYTECKNGNPGFRFVIRSFVGPGNLPPTSEITGQPIIAKIQDKNNQGRVIGDTYDLGFYISPEIYTLKGTFRESIKEEFERTW